MYILDFLNARPAKPATDDTVSYEYRLLCSGELYNGDIQTSDWRKSTATRCILNSPFTIVIASHPFNEYPQELALRFSIEQITEKRENNIRMFYPDDDIARDTAALLCLFCRRLITVSAKIRELYGDAKNTLPGWIQDTPLGFVNSMKVNHWKRQNAVYVEGIHGIEEVIDYNPDPRAISPKKLRALFLVIPNLPCKESFINAVRLYALAMERIQQDVDIAYQLLIASVETLANDIYKKYKPDNDDLVAIKKSVFDRAVQLGLSDKDARQLAIEACNGMSFNKRKFAKFLIENVGDQLWTQDDLFKTPDLTVPKKANFESALNEIYDARSSASHSGGSYPSGANIGTGPTVPEEIVWDLMTSRKLFPPVTWFERVVNTAIQGYLQRFLGDVAES